MNTQAISTAIDNINNHYKTLFQTIGCLAGCYYGFAVYPICPNPSVPIISACLGCTVGYGVHKLAQPDNTIIIVQPLSDRNISNNNHTSETRNRHMHNE